jgi:hypothetical protein
MRLKANAPRPARLLPKLNMGDRQPYLPSERSSSLSSYNSNRSARYQAQLIREVLQQETSKMRSEIQATLSAERNRLSFSPTQGPFDFVALPEVPEARGKTRVQATTRGNCMIPSWEGHKREQLLRSRKMQYYPTARWSSPNAEDDEEPVYDEYDAFSATSFMSQPIHSPGRSSHRRSSRHKQKRRRSSRSSSSNSSIRSARSAMSAPPQPIVYQFPIQVPYPSYYPPPTYPPPTYPPPNYSTYSSPMTPNPDEQMGSPSAWNADHPQAAMSSRLLEPRPLSHSAVARQDASTLAIPSKDRNLQTEEYFIEPRDPWAMQTGTSPETLQQAFMTQCRTVADHIETRSSSIPKVRHANKSKKQLLNIRKGLLKGKTNRNRRLHMS